MTTNIDFMGKRLIAACMSAVLLVVALGALTFNGLNWGLDFTGGSLVEVGFESELGRGSTFWVELPWRLSDDALKVALELTQPRGGPVPTNGSGGDVPGDVVTN